MKIIVIGGTGPIGKKANQIGRILSSFILSGVKIRARSLLTHCSLLRSTVNDQSLIPGRDARIGSTYFEMWFDNLLAPVYLRHQV